MHALGPAWEVVFRNDVHAPGSVDWVLMEGMVTLCAETAPVLYDAACTPASVYRPGLRPELEEVLTRLLTAVTSEEERVDRIAQFCSHLQDDCGDDVEAMRFGGTEEELIQRGSDWCADVARVACGLCQMAGMPARLLYTVRRRDAYCGHVVVEVCRRGRWGAMDPLCKVVFRWPDGRPASAWELMHESDLVLAHRREAGTPYTTPDQFGRCAISEYRFGDMSWYDYSVSGLNDYYRSIFAMALQGWPGGFRWLHGEDSLQENAGHE